MSMPQQDQPTPPTPLELRLGKVRDHLAAARTIDHDTSDTLRDGDESIPLYSIAQLLGGWTDAVVELIDGALAGDFDDA